MNRWKLIVTLLLIAALPVIAQEKAAKKKAAGKAPMDQNAMMELMGKLATPGDGHKKLDIMVGTWTATTNMWMEPGKPPEVSQGTSVHRWVLGNRYLEQRYEGTMFGMPFSGIGYTGFDNYKKKYLSTWMDTMSTTIMINSGTFDAAGKVLTASGKMDDPSKGKVVTIRTVTTMVNSDEMLFEMHGPGPDGKDYRIMEIRHKRKR